MWVVASISFSFSWFELVKDVGTKEIYLPLLLKKKKRGGGGGGFMHNQIVLTWKLMWIKDNENWWN